MEDPLASTGARIKTANMAGRHINHWTRVTYSAVDHHCIPDYRRRGVVADDAPLGFRQPQVVLQIDHAINPETVDGHPTVSIQRNQFSEPRRNENTLVITVGPVADAPVLPAGIGRRHLFCIGMRIVLPDGVAGIRLDSHDKIQAGAGVQQTIDHEGSGLEVRRPLPGDLSGQVVVRAVPPPGDLQRVHVTGVYLIQIDVLVARAVSPCRDPFYRLTAIARRIGRGNHRGA